MLKQYHQERLHDSSIDIKLTIDDCQPRTTEATTPSNPKQTTPWKGRRRKPDDTHKNEEIFPHGSKSSYDNGPTHQQSFIFAKALHLAIENNSNDVGVALLNHGIDPNSNGIEDSINLMDFWNRSNKSNDTSLESAENLFDQNRNNHLIASSISHEPLIRSPSIRSANLPLVLEPKTLNSWADQIQSISPSRNYSLQKRNFGNSLNHSFISNTSSINSNLCGFDRRSSSKSARLIRTNSDLSIRLRTVHIRTDGSKLTYDDEYNRDRLFQLPPIFLSVALNNSVLLKELISHGADVNSADDYGVTPLHLCLCQKQISRACLRLLIQSGAKLRLENKQTIAPFQLVDEKLFKEILQLQRSIIENSFDHLLFQHINYDDEGDDVSSGANKISNQIGQSNGSGNNIHKSKDLFFSIKSHTRRDHRKDSTQQQQQQQQQQMDAHLAPNQSDNLNFNDISFNINSDKQAKDDGIPESSRNHSNPKKDDSLRLSDRNDLDNNNNIESNHNELSWEDNLDGYNFLNGKGDSENQTIVYSNKSNVNNIDSTTANKYNRNNALCSPRNTLTVCLDDYSDLRNEKSSSMPINSRNSLQLSSRVFGGDLGSTAEPTSSCDINVMFAAEPISEIKPSSTTATTITKLTTKSLGSKKMMNFEALPNQEKQFNFKSFSNTPKKIC
ncbi:ankyrin repeat domain containing protein 11 [Sarcoptes scabiei]|uniref:Ankyrin repeat domain containing protein 11 n=1 Tax=Sarcoptes scabiei TaxID=52283 RepID=A0A132A125_SARSC|nr:ankyrin repeat domain containing protein 11 [Sarcoptes scabiei]